MAFIESVQGNGETPFVKNWMAKQVKELKE